MSNIFSQFPKVPVKLGFRLLFCVSQPPTNLTQNKYIIMMIQKIVFLSPLQQSVYYKEKDRINGNSHFEFYASKSIVSS